MTTFFLVLSLFLNILTLFLIIILYLRQNRFLHVEQKQESILHEMEEVISAYLVQMKEENEQFIIRVSKMEKENAIQNKAIHKDKKDMAEEMPTKQQIRTGNTTMNIAAKAYKQNSTALINHSSMSPLNEEIKLPPPYEKNAAMEVIENEEKENLLKQSPINEIILLQKKGYNVTEIAQKLHKGKTEIELLLKFYQNN